MKVLRAYTGFGALKCILSPANSMEDIARWNQSEVELFPLVMELHRIIRDNTASESQYKSYMQSLKNSVMTAFYTPEPVVREIAASLQEAGIARSEEHTSELQSRQYLVCRLLLEKKIRP